MRLATEAQRHGVRFIVEFELSQYNIRYKLTKFSASPWQNNHPATYIDSTNISGTFIELKESLYSLESPRMRGSKSK
jgi:hypothetical protein